jgi:hypothetical protein
VSIAESGDTLEQLKVLLIDNYYNMLRWSLIRSLWYVLWASLVTGGLWVF